MLLILWRGCDTEHVSVNAVISRIMGVPMDRAQDVSTRQERECITRIDSQSGVLWLCVFPFASLMVLDLEGGNRLTEE